jgi:DNA polymerase-3 subunit beta
MPINTTTTTATSLSSRKSGTLKLHITKSDLFKGIQKVQPAISTRGTLPVLGNILFEASEQGLRLSATDLEVGIRTWVKADVTENGAVTVPAKILSDFLRTLEEDREIKCEVTDNCKVSIRSGRDRLNVMGLPKEDYPVLPEFEEGKAVLIPKETLQEMIRKTIFSASLDETRYVLNGVHFIVDKGSAVAVATDGRRLSYVQRPIKDKELQMKVIIPTKAVQELLRIISDEKADENLKASFTENQASFFIGETLILSRLIEGHFPNFEQVIPKTHDIQLRMNRGALLASVTRAAVGTLERGGSVKLSLSKGSIRIQASAQGRVEAESELSAPYEGPNFEIAFNPLYLIDVLKTLDQDEVFVELSSPLNPGVVRPVNDDAYRYVMMPMKV